jgi:D-alanine-D-alanine ligase
MTTINVLLMWGGAGAEHEISQISAAYIEASLSSLPDFTLVSVELMADGQYRNNSGTVCQLVKNTLTAVNELTFSDEQPAWPVDFVIPCFHGTPGESGDIQSVLALIGVPFLGCGAEANALCFNKVTTKLWLNALNIPNTPYIMLSSMVPAQIDTARNALQQWQSVFIKASSQGSSVGCYQVDDEQSLEPCLAKAFTYSPYVLIEQTLVNARELEVAVYEYQGEVVATLPGEILSPEGTFYTYEEKYHNNSRSTTDIVASNLSDDQVKKIKHYAIAAFNGLKLRHLSRIDFFLTDTGQVLVNEVNTFPGLTPISMFPKMMEHHGHLFPDYLAQIIRQSIA